MPGSCRFLETSLSTGTFSEKRQPLPRAVEPEATTDMTSWRRQHKDSGWSFCGTGSQEDSQLLVSVYLQPKFMPARGLSRASRRILLTTSIWSAILFVFAFFLTYTVLLIYVDRPFQKANNKQDMFPGTSRNQGRPKVKFLGRNLGSNNRTSLRFSSGFHQRERLWDPGQFTDAESEVPTCKHGSLFIIIITSSPDHFRHRKELRNTWCDSKLSMQINGWQCLFLVGKADDMDIDSKLKHEMQSHNDILRGNYVDSYRNLTYKVMHGFAWIQRNCEAPFVLKTDDDCFVNTLLLRQFLLHHNTQTTNLYAGHMLINKNRRKVIRRPNEKWSVSKDDYLPEYYPVYASGSGYALSFDVLTKLIKESLFNKPIPNEDAYVGIVIARLGVQPTLSGRFTLSGVGLHLCNYMYIFVAHGVEPNMQKDMVIKAMTSQTKCRDEDEVTNWF